MSQRKPTNDSPRRLIIEELEPRILYSADFMPEVPASTATQASLVAEHRVTETAANPEAFNLFEPDDSPILILMAPDDVIPNVELLETRPNLDDTEIIVLYQQQENDFTVATTNEIVFVDTDVPDYQQLLNDLLSNPDQTKHIEVVLLNNEQQGISQISDALKQYQNLDAIHLISHGSAGNIELGHSQINPQSLLENAAEIQGWSDALNSDADFLIYGCNLASTPEGIQLVDQLAQLTGADVAASDDKTGNTALGGDWDLEYHSGSVEARVVFSDSLQQQWNGVLATELMAKSLYVKQSLPPITPATQRMRFISIFLIPWLPGNTPLNCNLHCLKSPTW